MTEVETGRRAKIQEIELARQKKPLVEFFRNIKTKSALSRRERLRIVDQALLLLEMNYVHLPLKRAMHAINPIQHLKLLKFRLETDPRDLEGTMQFHQRMLEIFASLRDLHTVYLLPDPFLGQFAFLPFLVEQYFEPPSRGKRVEKFVVSRVVDEIMSQSATNTSTAFEPGVEVLYWNGVPIRRAVERNGETQAGSNVEARFARGLDNLTIRPLELSLPPDETWVDLTYQSKAGQKLTQRFEWLAYDSNAEPLATATSRRKRAALDIKKTKINQLKRKLFGRRDVRLHKGYEGIFYAEVRTVGDRQFGYIRLFSFEVKHPDEFVEELRRVITSDKFPQTGLIIDVRGNPGGQIRAGERSLQFFTPRRVKPEIFEFINSTLNLELCRHAPKNLELARWADSIAESVITGATYSLGFPVNSEESCNDIGQVYYGPVILITDALSYSATDMFAAGFQDNHVGPILGTSDNTGAGGANVWEYETLKNNLGRSEAKSLFKPLPRDADFRVAIRRSIRVGTRDGQPLEELGVAPDHRHYTTKQDLMNDNVDLVKRAARILETKPIYSLSVKRANGRARALTVAASSKVRPADRDKAIARVDVILNGRPHRSLSATRGELKPTRVTLDRRTRKVDWLVHALDHHNDVVASYRGK